ncbi:MAG: hypothetical protein A3A43_00575 [Candidatus Liptonbacteria bacterium RIFCSPLOWO2_01_FULL_56_20]|uniref:Uncharacterized protein n=1 Tax=Candidatus Liptonbacteria bacterium RIFCSPLOWO2_01_FULL_56_20 TaxID=1798652 RepID=A0A1G2CKE7_9BACT|nr:MAG: hypothetical protein A2681_01715 [Candidatus Liptonbacteria bacterium RIFCSPHIGHO2_01_FULL_56_18b]OGZ01121.1 MAG: hypothetical protein A3A43_00575 [Candidatus Liptonbacteria bacterium RIFCSPLOWO2_01_FULL_56_20]
MKIKKFYWPTFIFWAYALLIILIIFALYGLKGLEWGQEGSFFGDIGIFGLFIQYFLGLAGILAINPVIIGLGLVSCGDGFLSLCLPSMYGVIFNLLFLSFIIFIINYIVVKFILSKKGN